MLFSHSIVLARFYFKSSLIDRYSFFSKLANNFFRLSGFLVLYRKWCEAQLPLCVENTVWTFISLQYFERVEDKKLARLLAEETSGRD